jgi:hypothetical protein
MYPLRRGQRGVQRSRQRQNDAVKVRLRDGGSVVRLSAGASAQGTKPVKMAWTRVGRLISHGSIEGSGTKQTAAAMGGDAGDAPRRVTWDGGKIGHLERVLGDADSWAVSGRRSEGPYLAVFWDGQGFMSEGYGSGGGGGSSWSAGEGLPATAPALGAVKEPWVFSLGFLL